VRVETTCARRIFAIIIGFFQPHSRRNDHSGRAPASLPIPTDNSRCLSASWSGLIPRAERITHGDAKSPSEKRRGTPVPCPFRRSSETGCNQ
jgi:hypothetical protein